MSFQSDIPRFLLSSKILVTASFDEVEGNRVGHLQAVVYVGEWSCDTNIPYSNGDDK
jgi:hypothetical protein